MHMVVEALVHMQWSWCKAFCANSTLLHTLAHCCRLVQIFAQAVVQETKYTARAGCTHANDQFKLV